MCPSVWSKRWVKSRSASRHLLFTFVLVFVRILTFVLAAVVVIAGHTEFGVLGFSRFRGATQARNKIGNAVKERECVALRGWARLVLQRWTKVPGLEEIQNLRII